MQRQFVSSSNLRSVGYDWGTQTLEIEFRNDRVYQYFKVPPERYVRLMKPGSKGTYFHYFIKDLFDYERVT